MKNVVITGSTRGIGLGLARAFLDRGHRVMINGRSAEVVREVVASLNGQDRVRGCACDVTDYASVENLLQQTRENLGPVDIWINNAGVTNDHRMAWEVEPDDIARVVNINVTGMMNGCRVALNHMLQQGHGRLYNMEGFGSNGRQFSPGMAPYGATKSAVRYYTRALIRETAGKPVQIGTISPGIVVTDLMREPYRDRPAEWEKARKIFNILGDRVETVTPWIADRVLADQKSGSTIAWLTNPKAMARFMGAAFRRRDLFNGAGA